jgi:coenzyme F420-0:L-glutamate ligase/coenzyme F420-1:gamma-L-glutamate ligase
MSAAGDGHSERTVTCAPRLELQALPGVPIVEPGDDLTQLAWEALGRASIALADGDVVVLASKVVSRAEGRFIDLARVEASARAIELAAEVSKDPRIVELILRDTAEISRKARGVLVVRHRLGFIAANASIDLSNAHPASAAPGSGPWVLVLPESPDASAERLRAALAARANARIGVVITDSLGRPFRMGTVGAAIGVAGLPALWDRRGEPDLFGRELETTVTALADQIAAAGDLVAGQADERRAFVHVRGLSFDPGAHSASELYRPPSQDLYA